MPEAKIEKLNWKQYSIGIAIGIVSIAITEICNRLFHLGHLNIAVLSVFPLGALGAYLSRKMEQKPVTKEFKDLMVLGIVASLTGSIPTIIVFNIFPVGHLTNYSLFLLISFSVLICTSLAMIILKKLGYCPKLLPMTNLQIDK